MFSVGTDGVSTGNWTSVGFMGREPVGVCLSGVVLSLQGEAGVAWERLRLWWVCGRHQALETTVVFPMRASLSRGDPGPV